MPALPPGKARLRAQPWTATQTYPSRTHPEDVIDRQSLVVFRRDLRDRARGTPESRESSTVESSLEALAAWIEDMDDYVLNRGEAVPAELS